MSLSGILRLEVEQLGDDEVRDLRVDLRAEEDDALVQQARVDVERALATRGLLDHHGDQRAHSGSLLPGVHNFFSGSVFSLSACRASRACRAPPRARARSASPRRRAGRARGGGAGPPAATPGGRAPRCPRSPASGSSSGRRGLLADQRLHVVVGDLDPGLVRDGLERELARDRARGLGAHLARRARPGDWPVTWKYVSGSIPRRPSERTKPSSSSRARVSTSGPAPWTFEASTSASTAARAEGAVDLLLDGGAHAALDVGAQLGQRVELARRARQLVVDLGQHLLVHVLDGDADAQRSVSSASSYSTSLVSPARAPTSAASISSTSRPEPSSTTVSDCVSPSGLSQVDDERVALLRRRGRRRARARRPTGAAPRAPGRRAPAAPRPRRAAPRASSSRRSRAWAAPRSCRRTSRAPCRSSAARSRTRDSRRGAAACGRPQPRTSR